MEGPRQPTWYEIVVETHDKIIPTDGGYQNLDEMLASAKELIVALRAEQDVGSWKVFLLPHWCEDRSTCECWDLNDVKPAAEYRGTTIDDL